jgi:hypothetical protein
MRADAISFSALTITARKDSERQLVLAKFRPAPEFDTLIDFGPDPVGQASLIRLLLPCVRGYGWPIAARTRPCRDLRHPRAIACGIRTICGPQWHRSVEPPRRQEDRTPRRQDAKRTGIDGGLHPISETRALRHTHPHRITGRRLPLTRVGDRTRRLSSEFAIPRNPSCLLPPNGSTASSPA